MFPGESCLEEQKPTGDLKEEFPRCDEDGPSVRACGQDRTLGMFPPATAFHQARCIIGCRASGLALAAADDRTAHAKLAQEPWTPTQKGSRAKPSLCRAWTRAPLWSFSEM